MSQENGVAKAIEAIYRDLEYAKSIVKPAPTEQEIHGPLEKVTSLLHPITSSESSVFRRSRSRKSGGEEDSEKMKHEEIREEKGDGSEESWDVVSNEDQQSPPQSHPVTQPQSPPKSQPQSQSHSVSLGNPIN